MSSNMERVAAMPDASLYVNRDGRRADDCVDSMVSWWRSIQDPKIRCREPKILAQGGCWWDYIQCLKMRKRKRKKRKKRKKKIRKKGGRRELNLK